MESKPDDGPRRPPWRGDRAVGSDLEVARRYIEQVRTRPPDEAVPRLVEILEDESWYLRERAGEALATYGLPAAVAVEQRLEGGLWYTRAAALRVLGQIAAPRSLLKVIEFLGDPNQTIAEEAGRALLAFGAQGHALAAAKLLHARGVLEREAWLGLLRRIDPDGAAKLQRLIEAPEFMGAEGALDPVEQEQLATEISDQAWGISWEGLHPAEPLPEPERDLLAHLRESAEA